MAVLTVVDLKAHLNLTTDTDDALLESKIAAVQEWIGKFTGCDLDADEIPAPVKEAARQLAAHLYENREASLVGVAAQQLPFGVLDLLTPYREWAF
jgi:uncharacterized phage protein (predicted DNA packaging)